VIVANVDDLRASYGLERQKIVDDVADAAQRIASIAAFEITLPTA
jgi:hypothetical protein